jgi:5'-nucleotidase
MKGKERPYVLITNDDGINAAGIRFLWEALRDVAEVAIVAPAVEQSGVGLALTLRQPLRLEQVKAFDETMAWSVNGTPADCVKMALSVILERKPDLLVSGINRGSNAGRNVLYSGTVGGAIEGVMQDVPSLAFSCHDHKDPNYVSAAEYIPFIVQHALEHPLPQGTLLNVNFPSSKIPEIKGLKMTRQGKELWVEDPEKRIRPADKEIYYWLGAKLGEFEEEEDCDISWLRKGYVTAVPVHVGDLTLNSEVHARRTHFEKYKPN